jgi:hypothetical protein
MKDLKNHHGELLNGLDILTGDHNELHDKINKTDQQKHINNPLFKRIDDWQKVTIEKVKQAADQARQQVTTILNSKHLEITAKFETFSKELVHMKETEEFVHDDLTRLQQMNHQLNQDIKQLSQAPTIVLQTEQSDRVAWDRLIYVEQKYTDAEKLQPQQQTTTSELTD